MVEFRAGASPTVEEEGGSAGDITLDDLVDQFVTNVQQNPRSLATLMDVAEEKGIDPELIGLVFPEAPQVKQQLEQAQKQQEQAENTEQPEPMDDPLDSVDADTAQDVIDLAIEMHPQGEDATLGGLKTLIGNNPELLENAKEMA